MQVPEQDSVTVDQIDSETVLLDVREDDEWADGHVESAIHIPMGQLPAAVAAGLDWLTPDTPVMVMCAVGGRSARVTAWLNQQGYQARNVEGGIIAWIEAGRPIVTGPTS